MWTRIGSWYALEESYTAPIRLVTHQNTSKTDAEKINTLSISKYRPLSAEMYYHIVVFFLQPETSLASFAWGQNQDAQRVILKITESDLQSIGILLDDLSHSFALPYAVNCELKINLDLVKSQNDILNDLRTTHEQKGFDIAYFKALGYVDAIAVTKKNEYEQYITEDWLKQFAIYLESRGELMGAVDIYNELTSTHEQFELTNRILGATGFANDYEKFSLALRSALKTEDEPLIHRIFHQLCQPYEIGLECVTRYPIDATFSYEQHLTIANFIREKNRIIHEQKKMITALQNKNNATNVGEPTTASIPVFSAFESNSSTSSFTHFRPAPLSLPGNANDKTRTKDNTGSLSP
jgi:hypothetical protein